MISKVVEQSDIDADREVKATAWSISLFFAIIGNLFFNFKKLFRDLPS